MARASSDGDVTLTLKGDWLRENGLLSVHGEEQNRIKVRAAGCKRGKKGKQIKERITDEAMLRLFLVDVFLLTFNA